MHSIKIIKTCLSALALLLMLTTIVLANPAGDNIIISEIEYDPATPAGHTSFEVENEAEWFELFNPTANPVDIGNWTIKEGNTPTYTFPAPTVIAAGDYLLVTNRADRFNLNYPAIVPDQEMQPGGAGLLRLNNGGDELTLKNDSGTTIDYVAWEGYAAGWNAAAVNGPICRINNIDSDAGPDWGACAATPGEGPGFTLSKTSSSISEGNTDTFSVVLDTQPTSDVVIELSSDDSAAASVAPISLTFTAANWDIPQTVTITGVEDDADLYDEAVTITASINDASSDDTFDALIDQMLSVAVADNDLAKISIDDVTHVEANSGNTDYTFTISIDYPSPDDISVDYATADVSATTADNDYIAVPTTTITIPAGDTSATVVVQSVGDNQVESDEEFRVDLSNPINATILDAQGEATITNDDAAQIFINDVTHNEGLGGTTSYVFTVSIDNPSDTDITFDYATANNTALSADNDYTTIPVTQGTIAAGSLSTTVTVLVTGDNKVENNETFVVQLTSPAGAAILDDLGIGTISNDDAAQISINDVTHNEGNSGNTSYIFTISIDNPSATDITLDYATADNTALMGDSDYTAVPVTQASIPAGSLSTIVTVLVSGDNKVENNETFVVQLTNPTGATILDAEAVATINNDDNAGFTLAPTSITIDEGNTSTLSVVLTAQPATDVVIDLLSADNGALSSSPTSLTFSSANWNIPQSVTVTGEEDADLNDENVIFTASINDAVSDDFFDPLAAQTASITVIDDDIDTDGDGIPDEDDLDKDNDGNPDVTDPHPLVATAMDDLASAVAGATVTFNILANDDFIAATGLVISNTGNGTAAGLVSFDALTGEMSYTPDVTELGEVTLEYRVCNTAVVPEVCALATVTITVAAAPVIVPSSIPTLSEWMLMVLSLLLLLVGIQQSKQKV